MTAQDVTPVDVVIFGGGVAGLWTLNRLRRTGYQAILLESERLGEGQTRYAQGIIHGGTKYALTGKLTASAEAVSKMPSLWRDCLAGRGEIDLSSVRLLAEHQYLWSTSNLTSRLSGFFASKLMKSRTTALDKHERPVVFQHPQFKGRVYQLDEPVLDVSSLLPALAEPQRDAIARCDRDTLTVQSTDDAVEIQWQADSHSVRVKAEKVVLCAGAGNARLLQQLGLEQPQMQRRPLHMVLVRGMPEPLYAHCLGASTLPRVTVTAHPDPNDGWVWYLGGQLAEEGVKRSEEEQIHMAKQEVRRLFPWLDFSASQWATLRVDRAEPLQAGGQRPDTAFVQRQHDIIITWPTKLALAPLLAGAVIDALQQSGLAAGDAGPVSVGPFPGYAPLPWQEEQRWS